ncbi:MAG: aromatic ring-hydroxylating dioxygenase subunit alpha [Pirellulaceae bacterium]
MFVHSTHLPQLLSPEHYFGGDAYQAELRNIFLPSWQLVGTVSQVRSDGDFFTRQLFDRPIIVWRHGESLRAFINVCPHRFATLTSSSCGRMSPLVCQYHGWEFDGDGCTRKIPDAQSFRPLSHNSAKLTAVRVETCGQLIFVCFDPQTPPLNEWLGDVHTRIAALCGPTRPHVDTLDKPLNANWKIAVENAIESYHIDCVHGRTFQKSPPADRCDHELCEQGSSFETTEPPPVGRWQQFGERLYHHLLGWPYHELYRHEIVHPNLMLGRSRTFSWAMTAHPTSARHSQLLLFLYCHPPNRTNPFSRSLFWVAKKYAARFTRTAIEEDMAILPPVQQGLESAELPRGGLISVREERVHHFQKYVLEKLLLQLSVPVRLADELGPACQP